MLPQPFLFPIFDRSAGSCTSRPPSQDLLNERASSSVAISSKLAHGNCPHCSTDGSDITGLVFQSKTSPVIVKNGQKRTESRKASQNLSRKRQKTRRKTRKTRRKTRRKQAEKSRFVKKISKTRKTQQKTRKNTSAMEISFRRRFLLSNFVAENNIINPSWVRVSREESSYTSTLLTKLGNNERNHFPCAR